MLATQASAASAAMENSFAQELRVLKTELQRTLARLGAAEAPRRARYGPASPWSQTSTATTATPTTVQSEPAYVSRERQEVSSAAADRTTRILQELVATASRRRQVEMRLALELQRDARVHDEYGDRPPRSHRGDDAGDVEDQRETAIRREIESLRLRRKQILHQIDDESKAEEDTRDDASLKPQQRQANEEPPVGHHRQNLSASIKHRGDNEFSIEGVVKLAAIQNSRHAQEPRRTDVPTAPSRPSHPSKAMEMYTDARHHHRQLYGRHHDMMQDVFSIQLKFAETMLQLEKSIQARDRLLVPTASTSRRRSAGSRRQAPARRRSRQPSTIHEDMERDPADSSSGDGGLQLGLSSDEASMSENTMRLWRRYRLDRQRTPPGVARSAVSMGGSVATTTASTTPDSQPSPLPTESVVAATPDALTRLSSSRVDEALMVTPSTNDSSNKQVRFHEAPTDEYPTPLIARNISFDQDSIDSSTDDDQPMVRRFMMSTTQRAAAAAHRKRLSVTNSDDETLSFLDGSSVCSADLNDESFLAAFTALRMEVGGGRQHAAAPPMREEQSVAGATAEPTTVSSPADAPALARRMRALTLDIQALTATLVLAQDAAQRDQARAAIARLRRQLHTVDALAQESGVAIH